MGKEYEGIAALGITTAAYLQNPELAFAVVDRLNNSGYGVALELYPFHTPKIVSKAATTLLGGGNGRLPVPAKVDPLLLGDWKLIFPSAKVTQLHLPFAYDFPQAVYWARFWGKDSPLSNAHHLAHMVCFGWATDGNTEKIVEAVGNPDLVLNIHPEVAWKALRKGNLGRFTKLGRVAIEDTTNPPLTFRTLKENKLDLEFTLGLDHPDHLATVGLSVDKVLKDEEVRRYTTAIHLSRSSHGSTLAEIASTPFHHPVIAYLDLHPSTLNGMSYKKQLDFWQKQLDFIKSTQPQLT